MPSSCRSDGQATNMLNIQTKHHYHHLKRAVLFIAHTLNATRQPHVGRTNRERPNLTDIVKDGSGSTSLPIKPILSPSVPFSCLPHHSLHLPNAAIGLGSAVSFPSGSGQSQVNKRILVYADGSLLMLCCKFQLQLWKISGRRQPVLKQQGQGTCPTHPPVDSHYGQQGHIF